MHILRSCGLLSSTPPFTQNMPSKSVQYLAIPQVAPNNLTPVVILSTLDVSILNTIITPPPLPAQYYTYTEEAWIFQIWLSMQATLQGILNSKHAHPVPIILLLESLTSLIPRDVYMKKSKHWVESFIYIIMCLSVSNDNHNVCIQE